MTFILRNKKRKSMQKNTDGLTTSTVFRRRRKK